MKFKPQHQRKFAQLLFLLVGACLSAFWLLKVFDENINFYITPDEVTQNTPESTVYLGGYVSLGSLAVRDDTVFFTLQTQQNNVMGNRINVIYKGLLPDLFKEGEFAIAIGAIKQNQLHANKVLAKHDENYKPPSTKKIKNDS